MINLPSAPFHSAHTPRVSNTLAIISRGWSDRSRRQQLPFFARAFLSAPAARMDIIAPGSAGRRLPLVPLERPMDQLNSSRLLFPHCSLISGNPRFLFFFSSSSPSRALWIRASLQTPSVFPLERGLFTHCRVNHPYHLVVPPPAGSSCVL